MIQSKCYSAAVAMTVVRARIHRASAMASVQDVDLSEAVYVSKSYYNIAVSDTVKHNGSAWYLRVVAE